MADTHTPVAPQRQQYVNLDLVRHMMQRCTLSGVSRWILFTIASHANREHRQCFCSINTLARESGWSRRTVTQHIGQLEQLGLLKCVGMHHSGTNIYQVQLDEVWQRASASANVASTASAPERPPVVAAPAPAPAPAPMPTSAPVCDPDLTPAPAPTPAPEMAPVAAPVPSPAPPPTVVSVPVAATAPTSALLLQAACTGTTDPISRPAPAPAPIAAGGANSDGAINADTIGQLNAQRRRNGKDPLCHHDIVQLGTEAAKAGLTPLQAAQWVLARPKRNFFRAEYYTPPPAAPEPPSPDAQAAARVLACLQPPSTALTTEEQEARARAGREANEHLRQYLAGLKISSDQSICTRDGGPHDTGAPSTPKSGPPNTRWARQAIELFVAGQTVSHYRLHTACKVLGIQLPKLRAHTGAQRPGAS